MGFEIIAGGRLYKDKPLRLVFYRACDQRWSCDNVSNKRQGGGPRAVGGPHSISKKVTSLLRAGTRKMALSDVGGFFCAVIGLAENQLERNGRIWRGVREHKPPSLELTL